MILFDNSTNPFTAMTSNLSIASPIVSILRINLFELISNATS